MLRRRFSSFFKNSPKSKLQSTAKSGNEEDKGKAYVRKAVSFLLITVTGGVALSALDDLAIYHSCTSDETCRKAMEKASGSQEIKDALGEPIVKGPWYSASLAVAHKRQSVSCTFPVSGPQGTGVLQLKAIRSGEDSWFSVWRPLNWDIIVMDALLHIPANEEKHRTFRINISDNFPAPASAACIDCKPHDLESQG